MSQEVDMEPVYLLAVLGQPGHKTAKLNPILNLNPNLNPNPNPS